MTDLKNLVSFGNNKLPKSTMIFNLGAASDCPSAKLGLCKVPGICYAKKAEKIYPSVLPYRQRQAEYWLNNPYYQIIGDFSDMLAKKRIKPTKFRLNESGDFYSQNCIEKAEKLAEYLFLIHKIVTYTYSSRSDLDFSKCQYLHVKGSGHDAGNNGKTVVIDKSADIPASFILCPGSCKSCAMCSSDKKINIAFKKH